MLMRNHSNAHIRRVITATNSFPLSVGSADHPRLVMAMTMTVATPGIFLPLIHPFLLPPLV